MKPNLSNQEYAMLIASLIYSVDKIANTVGHYDAYFKKPLVQDRFALRFINPVSDSFPVHTNISIFRKDANALAQEISADIVYIDPPYNSRQYSRFYHVLETLTKWDKPKLYGVALKPQPENMSDYCRVSARSRLSDLVMSLRTKHIVVSYNNTYSPKSNSSLNKITLEEIHAILSKRGRTTMFEKQYRHFNAGNSHFADHKEYVFVCTVNQTSKP